MKSECDICGEIKNCKDYHCWSNTSNPRFYLGIVRLCKECEPIQKEVGDIEEEYNG